MSPIINRFTATEPPLDELSYVQARRLHLTLSASTRSPTYDMLQRLRHHQQLLLTAHRLSWTRCTPPLHASKHLSPCTTRPINTGLSVRSVSTSSARRRTRKKVKAPVIKVKEAVVKWKTLQHEGVLFPPLYVPHGVNILYQG